MFKRLRENLGWLVAGFMVAIPVAYGAAAIFSGDDVKIFRPNLNLNDQSKILSDAQDDPNAATAKIGPAGSLYLEDGGTTWRKGVNGWQRLSDLHYVHYNILRDSNPGAEESDELPWSETIAGGSLGFTKTPTDVAFGLVSISYNAGVGSELSTESVSIPPGLYGKQCEARIWVKGGDENLTFKVTDGTNDLASKTMSAPTVYKEERLAFVCPSSGTLDIRIKNDGGSAAPIAYFDDAYIGESLNEALVSPGSELVVHAQAPAAFGCVWTGNGSPSTFTDMNTSFAGATCNSVNSTNGTIFHTAPGITVSSTDTDLPEITVENMPAGSYFIRARFYGGNQGQATETYFTLSDESTSSQAANSQMGDTRRAHAASGNGPHAMNLGLYRRYTTEGTHTFKVQCYRSVAGLCSVSNDSGMESLAFEIFRHDDLIAQRAVVPEMQGWYVDVHIDGTNVGLGVGSIGTFTQAEASALTLTKNGDSKDALIACVTGEASSSTTCSGNEATGLSFDAPLAGTYEVCGQVGFNSSTGNGGPQGLWRWFQTDDDSTTTLEGGAVVGANEVHKYYHNDQSSDVIQETISVCGVFTFATKGKKTLRLMRTQACPSCSAYDLRMSGTNSENLHITVKPIAPHQASPLLISSLNTPSTDKTFAYVSVNILDGACNYDRELGDWVSSVTPDGSGSCKVNFNSGFFSAAPNCQVTYRTNGLSRAVCHTLSTINDVDITCVHTYFGSATPPLSTVACHGPR